ncbi:hypothetical protein DBR11_11810 [Pedobacter sp. HMWF019]|uniref:hypothetical protein n=1 Tax=Pedobacter sp. HMWF019 TaxID=2056856 RepID=UPI000D36837A|nr:hypothetical protein [Pedobacter sp. HMWF019]PTS99666.1 hypothetical protein DBR11_11810 [Pedobacter sp. HMWF019]
MKVIEEIKQIKDLTDSEIENIFVLVQAHYVDATYVVTMSLKHNNIIYLLKDGCNNILSFFMVAWEKHKIQSVERDVVYLGFNCTSQNHQGENFSLRLNYNIAVDGYNYQQKNNNKLIVYCRTATPIILLLLPKIWDNVKPDLDGNYNKNDENIIESLKKSSGLDKFSTDHPYVLKGVTANTQYSVREKARQNECELKNDIKTFEKLNIDESNGDRLLITCEIPSKSKLDRIKSKLAELSTCDGETSGTGDAM